MDQISSKLVFPVENEKSEQHHWTLRIRISLSINFHRKLTILYICTKCAQKGYFQSKTKKNEQHHRSMHIRIMLATKFQLTVIILIFWNKFAQKGYFRSKTKKVNSIIEFCIFELS